jgi:hypothetical protein
VNKVKLSRLIYLRQSRESADDSAESRLDAKFGTNLLVRKLKVHKVGRQDKGARKEMAARNTSQPYSFSKFINEN